MIYNYSREIHGPGSHSASMVQVAECPVLDPTTGILGNCVQAGYHREIYLGLGHNLEYQWQDTSAREGRSEELLDVEIAWEHSHSRGARKALAQKEDVEGMSNWPFYRRSVARKYCCGVEGNVRS